jgi:trimeric autotransporter adhesin
MKILAAMTLVLLPTFAFSQTGSINNTLAAGGSFTIKDGSTTFLSLSQSDGTLSLNNMLTLPSSTDSTLGVIYKGTIRFIHDFQGSGTTGDNTFMGHYAGNFTMGGLSFEASHNTGVGYSSLSSLTTGSLNSAFGDQALTSNTSGTNNAAFGQGALYTNTSGSANAAFGNSALAASSGDQNSAFGFKALEHNTTGSYNTAFGSGALDQNTAGASNSAFGTQALLNSTGGTNSGFGNNAGSSITTGSNNICIGNNAQVPDGTLDNQVRIGDANVTYAGIEVDWSITSDRRAKSNIANSSLGLHFVSKLRPVSYTRRNDEDHRTEYGFIAQDIGKTLEEEKIKNPGMLTIDDQGMYHLRYNDLLAPMVKAIQELKAENDRLKRELTAIRSSVAEQVRLEIQKALQDPSQSKAVSTHASMP